MPPGASDLPYISMTFTNFLTFMSMLSPFLLIFFIIMYSIVQNIINKGLIFLLGVFLVSGFIKIAKILSKTPLPDNMNSICKVMPIPIADSNSNSSDEFNFPMSNITLLSYILSYLIFPMYLNNYINYGLLVVLIGIFGMNLGVFNCGEFSTILSSIVIGLILGIVYYMLLVTINMGDLGYFVNNESNASGCYRASKQRFKCVSRQRG